MMAKLEQSTGVLYVNDEEYHRIIRNAPLVPGQSSRDVAARILPLLFPWLTTKDVEKQKICFIVNTSDQ